MTQVLKQIADACAYLLESYPGAQGIRDYLDSRLTKESQQKFGFGYFPPLEELNVLTDLISEETLIGAGLMRSTQIEDISGPYTRKKLHFQYHPMVMPFHNTYGEVAGLVGRTMLPEIEWKNKKIDKYKNTSPFKKGNYLFGLYHNKQAILDAGCVYIVEGQFDVIKAGERGIKNIVAVGNNTLSSYQYSLISRYCSNLILLLDNDEAGEKGRASIQRKFGQLSNIQNFYVPEGSKDIDEYLTKVEGEPEFVVRG